MIHCDFSATALSVLDDAVSAYLKENRDTSDFLLLTKADSTYINGSLIETPHYGLAWAESEHFDSNSVRETNYHKDGVSLFIEFEIDNYEYLNELFFIDLIPIGERSFGFFVSGKERRTRDTDIH